MPREIGEEVYIGDVIRECLIELLWELIWEASFYLMESSFRFWGPLGSDGRLSCHTIIFPS